MQRPAALRSLFYATLILLAAASAYAVSAWPPPSNAGAAIAGPAVGMQMSTDASVVSAGATVDVAVDLSNTGDQSAFDLSINVTLPPGFSYVAGSAQIAFNDIDSWWPDQNPSLAGSTLTWNGQTIADFVVPAKRYGNYYGIHTFVQDNFYDPHPEQQLSKAREMTGEGGYVTQLLYPVTPDTARARDEWRDFVQRACAKQLTPIVRLATRFTGTYWEKPTLDGALARAFGRVAADLKNYLPANCTLYVQVLNETNLNIEWSGEWPDPVAYGQFLVQAASEIHNRTGFDTRIKVLNAAPSPGGNYNNISYTWDMLGVDGALWAWDAWASHPYPANHPAGYNLHAGTAVYPELTVDSYILEMQQISRRGRHVYDVLATETGYRLTDSTYWFEGYPPVSDDLRAGYIADAFQNQWTNWPEFRASTPYELSDPARNWWQFDWLRGGNYGDPYKQFVTVRDIPYKPGYMPSGKLTIQFRVRAGYTAGSQIIEAAATASNAAIASASVTLTVLPGGATPTRTRTPTRTATPQPGVPTATATSVPTPTATPLVCAPVSLATFAVGAHPKGVAVDATTHRLYVGLFDSSRLTIFDTQTYAHIADVDTRGSHANGVANDVQTGMVYVTNRDSANVSVINGRNGAFVTLVGTGHLPFGVAAGDGYAYVANFGLDNEEGTVSIINTSSNTLVSTARIGPHPALAASGDGRGYVVSAGTGTGSGALYTLVAPDQVGSVTTGYFAFGAAFLDGRVYVTHRGGKSITIIDAATNRLLDTIAMPGPVYAAAANPTSHHVFAVDAENNRVYVVDGPTATLIAEVPVGVQNGDDGGQGIAVDSDLNRVFVANFAEGTVSVIADCMAAVSPTPTTVPPTSTATPSATNTPAPTKTGSPTPTSVASTATVTPAACLPSVGRTVSVGVHPKSLAIDSSAHLLHAALFDSSQVVSIDSDSLAPLRTLALAPLGSSQPNGIAVDQATGRVYVTSRQDNNLAVIDGRTGAWLTRVSVGRLPWGVAAADGRAYVANFTDGTATLIDTASNSVLGTASVGSQPALAAAGGGKGYITSFAGGSVALVSGAGPAQQVSTGPQALGVAYMNGRVYAGSRAGSIAAVDALSGQIVYTTSLPGPAYGVAANPLSGHLFVVDAQSDRLYALNAADGSLLVDLPIGHQDANDGGQGIAVDPASGQVFVANYAAGSVTVINDCWAQAATPTPSPSPVLGAYRAFAPLVVRQHAGSDPWLWAKGAGLSGHSNSEAQVVSLSMRGQSIAVDGASGESYIAGSDGLIAALDGALGAQRILAPLGSTAAEPGAIVAAGGRVYASYPAIGSVVIANGKMEAAQRVSGLARPFGLALDAETGRLYVAESGASTVAVLDINTAEVVNRLQVGQSPFLLALDAVEHVLYVATPGDKSIWVVPLALPEKAQRVAVPGLGLTMGLTVDARGQAFAVYAVSPKTRAIARLDKADAGAPARLTGIVQATVARPLVEAAGIAAANGRVYVADGGTLWGFSADAGAVVEQYQVDATAGAFGLAIDSAGQRILIADARGGPVRVVSGIGEAP